MRLRALFLTLLLAATAVPAAADPGIVERDVLVTSTVDGTQLEMRYRRPSTGGGYPVVLLPHGGGGTVDTDADRARRFAEAGFVAVTWSARGHGRSEGLYDLFGPLTIQDTKDVLDWILDHRDETGAGDRVGSLGDSQGGGTTNLLAALDDRVEAIQPGSTFSGLEEALYENGCLKLTTDLTIMTAAYYAQGARLDPRISGTWSAAALTGVGMDGIREEMEVRSPRNYADRIDQPTLWVQQFDDPLFPVHHGVLMDDLLPNPHNRLWLTWGGHFATTDISGELPAREDAKLGWMQRWLQGRSTPHLAGPRVTWWALNEDRDGLVRRDSATWPPPGTRARTVELPDAQLLQAGGLQGVADDPIAAWGLEQVGLGAALTALPNHTPADTLVASTPPLEHPAVYAGAATADLRMRSTASESQANVKVWDVAPDGAATLVARGCTVVSGGRDEVQRVRFDLWHAAVEIPAGHHLEVWVQPADATTFRPPTEPGVVTIEGGSTVDLPLLETARADGSGPPDRAEVRGVTARADEDPATSPRPSPAAAEETRPLPVTGGGPALLPLLALGLAVALFTPPRP
jgi:ABC-2 type transport system ATP-binding protein